jgi:hypothetical protein
MALPILPPRSQLFGQQGVRRPLLTPQIRAALFGGTLGAGAGAGAPTGPPQRGPGKWNYPDYNALLAGDPSLMGAMAQIAAAGAGAGREKVQAVRRAITQFGEVPAAGAPMGDIDEATRLAATQNPLSTVRQLDEARGHGRADLAAALAGRGMLQSGGLVGGEQKIQQGFERGRGMATQSLLDALSGYETSFAEAQRELALEELRQREAAASRVSSTYMPWWEEGAPVPPPPTAPTTPPPPSQTPTFVNNDLLARIQQLLKSRTSFTTPYTAPSRTGGPVAI